MSWSLYLLGRSAKVAEIVKERFEKVSGCHPDSAEERAKNELGVVAETLCRSLVGNPIVRIEAGGSCWQENGKAKSQAASFKFETLYGDFIE